MLLDISQYFPQLREFLAGCQGRRILHLSDTPVPLYPQIKELAALCRPDVTVHTGDCADEYKVGRREEDTAAYCAAVPELMAALTEYSGSVCVVPGNNDLPAFLAALPGITLLKPWSRLTVGSVTAEVSHEPNPNPAGADFALYGHSAFFDQSGCMPESAQGTRCLNGNYDFTLIDAETGRFLRIPYRKRPQHGRIFILRHGQPASFSETESNPDYPKGDPPLTEIGILQAKYAAKELEKRHFCGTIYSSPFLRALETAQQAARTLHLPIRVCAEIREISKPTSLAPDFVGETAAQMRLHIPEIDEASVLPDPWWSRERETSADVRARVAPFLDKLLERGEDAAIFAHGAVVHAAVDHLIEKCGVVCDGFYPIPPRTNCAISGFEFRCGKNKKLHPLVLNGTDHLPSELIFSNRLPALSPVKKTYLTQMHLHADFEERASLRSHASQAAALGCDVLFITEHDTRICAQNAVRQFSVPCGGDAVNERGIGWYTDEKTPYPAESQAGEGRISLTPERPASFDGKKFQQFALFAGVTLRLKADVPEGAAFTADVRLSQRPDLKEQHLCYTLGGCRSDGGEVWTLPLPPAKDGVFTLPISEDVLRFDPEFGQDCAFLGLTLRGTAKISSFSVDRRYTGNAALEKMRALAGRVGEAYGLKILPRFEVTFGRNHHNCFSEKTPIIDYDTVGFVESEKTGAAYLRSRKALFACNHPFWPYRKQTRSHEEIFSELLEELASTHCFGAQLLEVGFPEGRWGFTLEEHLRLWDALSLRGVRMIAYGGSDCHDSRKGWKSGNCFASWITSTGSDAASLEAALRAGQVCFGDPNRFSGSVQLSSGMTEMGKCVFCRKDSKKPVTVTVRGAAGCTLRLIAHGEPIMTLPVPDDEITVTVPFRMEGRSHSLFRAEVLRDGVPVFFTNPVFFSAQM